MNRNNINLSFWVRVKKNPDWSREDSKVRFPPLNIDELSVFLIKEGMRLEIYVVSENGIRKNEVDLVNYLGKDTLFQIAISSTRITLKVNGSIVSDQSFKPKSVTNIEFDEFLKLYRLDLISDKQVGNLRRKKILQKLVE